MLVYSALLCIAVHPKCFTIMCVCVWGSLLNNHQWDDVTAATGQRRQCTHHTPATGERRESHRANQVYALTTHQLQVERERERVIEPIKCMRSPHTSYRWRGGESGERVIEQSSVCAHHTPATGGEERES